MTEKTLPILKKCPFCGAEPMVYDSMNALGNHTKDCFLWSVLGNIPSYLMDKWNVRYDENGELVKD